MSYFLQITIGLLADVSAILSIFLFVRLHWPARILWIFKIFVSALSSWLIFIGLVCGIVGLSTHSLFLSLIGTYVTLAFYCYVFRVTRPPASFSGFDKVFGPFSFDRIAPEQRKYFLPRRTVLFLPRVPKPVWKQNVLFSTIPENGRKLLCDLWQPNKNISRSGLAFIYLHGSAWYLLDKDVGTRPLFCHLTAQGHIVMDVAYRLAPETDVRGMVHDVKRAIAWLKENAAALGINPDKIVVGGGSAGGHLAMLAAYTANNSQFIPKEIEEKDTSVCAVISMYGPSDLVAIYYHTKQYLKTSSDDNNNKTSLPSRMSRWAIKTIGKEYYRLKFYKGFAKAGALVSLLGGHPENLPEIYAFYSPVTHIHSNCPPTLLIQGEHDVMVPASSIRFLYAQLTRKKVKAVLHVLPQTDHAFDLILPKMSLAAHSAFYDIERFLALQASTDKNNASIKQVNEHLSIQ